MSDPSWEALSTQALTLNGERTPKHCFRGDVAGICGQTLTKGFCLTITIPFDRVVCECRGHSVWDVRK